MNTFQPSHQFSSTHYDQYYQSPHLENMKKSSKSISKYIQSSSMLYSPNKRMTAIDDTIKNNLYTNNSQQYSQINNQITQQNGNLDKDQTTKAVKSNNQYSAKNTLQPHSPVTFNNLGRVVSKLQTRMDGVQVKITSLTNIVKLLQRYSQTKDDQYQKQKENILFTKNFGQKIQQIQNLQIENKIKEFNALSKQMKRQIQQTSELRHKMEVNLQQSLVNPFSNNEIKKYTSSKSKKSDQHKSPTSSGSLLDVEDLALAFQQMENRLREQINKKVQICLKQIKKINPHGNSCQVSGVDQNLFEEQINGLNFAINNVQNECVRNRMLLEKQIQEIMSKMPTIFHSASLDYLPRKFSNFVDPVITQKAVRDKSRNKSHSRKKSTERQPSREKSKSNLKKSQISDRSKLEQNLKEKLKIQEKQKIQQKKRIKQEQLKQAIRRKKQTKDRMKGKI